MKRDTALIEERIIEHEHKRYIADRFASVYIMVSSKDKMSLCLFGFSHVCRCQGNLPAGSFDSSKCICVILLTKWDNPRKKTKEERD